MIDHMLCYVKDCHGDIKGICNKRYCYKGLEYPLEKDPGFKVCQVIVSDDQLYQLIAGNKRKDDSCYG